ncbi:hypothetical protein TrRE_jg2403 [Triparma retinervis]|uniref:Uncharacterized protein n=1 Tax=Triparma retinervis TaxID=2557542 RepID=A0A9W6Z356_9STRA|nr:hypothetical protein TrRE_jg2403 [Triparma retinervis]
MLETSAMYDSLPDEFHCLTDAAEFNYIREILPKLPTPPLHVAFTRDAGFPRSQPASASSLSDVAFRAILLTSFLTTSMISTVVPQHLNVLPAIENHQTAATIFFGMMMLGLGREAAAAGGMGSTALSPAAAAPVNPLKALKVLNLLVEAAVLRQTKRMRRKNDGTREVAILRRVTNQKRLLWCVWEGDVDKIRRFIEGGEEGGGEGGGGEEEPFLLDGIDYTLPVAERGGVDIDAFYMSPIMLDESVDMEMTEADMECYNSIPQAGLDDGATNQSRNFDSSMSPPDASRMISPVLMACQFNRHKALEYLLLRTGGAADVNSRDANGWGGGHFTVVNNGVESLRVLMLHQCNLSLESQSGYTPYQMSEKLSMQGGEVWKLLREEGGGDWFTKQGVGEFVGRTVEEMLDSLNA